MNSNTRICGALGLLIVALALYVAVGTRNGKPVPAAAVSSRTAQAEINRAPTGTPPPPPLARPDRSAEAERRVWQRKPKSKLELELESSPLPPDPPDPRYAPVPDARRWLELRTGPTREALPALVDLFIYHGTAETRATALEILKERTDTVMWLQERIRDVLPLTVKPMGEDYQAYRYFRAARHKLTELTETAAALRTPAAIRLLGPLLSAEGEDTPPNLDLHYNDAPAGSARQALWGMRIAGFPKPGREEAKWWQQHQFLSDAAWQELLREGERQYRQETLEAASRLKIAAPRPGDTPR